ncbi:MAG TPA: SRPBCC domain-containing protein [Falsiroseomonas sp.]|jgi:uncharacterized protein YndB with AHSA1/START domain|nr:SRPBCC domain-containing protein [Falsiroseomonas sp.]
MNVVAPSLTLVKRIKAPPSRVWAAWTQPELMLLWFGPHHTRAEQAEADLREGGRFRVALREDNGERHEATGSYLEIEQEKRLVFSWHWVSMPERVSRVTVVLRVLPEGTEVTLTHDRFADADTAKRHTRGWTESLERLVTLLNDAG